MKAITFRTEELLRQSGWVRSLAYAIVKDHALAEDITQETLLRAIQAKRPADASLRGWLAAVTRNLSRNELRTLIRRRAREEKVASENPMVDDSSRHELLFAHQELNQAILELSERNQEIIVLRFYQGLTYRQIAEQVGISESNARTRLHRALQEIKSKLKAKDHEWLAGCMMIAAIDSPEVPAKPSLPAIPLGMQGLPALGWATAFLIVVAVVVISLQGNSPTIESELAGGSGIDLPAEQSAVALLAKEEPLRTLSDENAVLNREGDADGPLVEGIVVHNGLPVSSAEIVVWQNNKKFDLQTDGGGKFKLTLPEFETAVIHARWNEMSTWQIFNYMNGSVRLRLVEASPAARSVVILDAVDGSPIPGARVSVFWNWASTLQPCALKLNASEFVFEAKTDQNGKILLPSELAGASLRCVAEASGYSVNQSLEREVKLFPELGVPIQLVDSNGKAIPGIRLWEGVFVNQEQFLGDHAEINQIQEWAPAVSTQKVASLPRSLVAYLPDGRIWEAQAADFKDEDVVIQADRIQLMVDQSPVLVHVQVTGLPTGNWLEARCRPVPSGYSNGPLPKERGNWLPYSSGDEPWQRLDASTTVLEKGWLAPKGLVSVRVMPKGNLAGLFTVINKESNVVLDLKPIRVSLSGANLARYEELYALGYFGEEIPFQNGVAEWNIQQRDFFILQVREKTTHKIVTIRTSVDQAGATLLGHGQAGKVLMINTMGSELLEVPVSLDSLTEQLVLVRINGEPVVGWERGGTGPRPDAEGRYRLNFDEDGKLNFSGFGGSNIDLVAAEYLHEQAGGPILSRLNFSKKCVPPGKLKQDENGQWIWDLELCEVVLLVPPGSGAFGVRLFHTEYSGVSNNLTSPEAMSRLNRGSRQLHIPLEGGEVKFRVPAGRHRFLIDGQTSFGGQNGVELAPGSVTILSPDS